MHTSRRCWGPATLKGPVSVTRQHPHCAQAGRVSSCLFQAVQQKGHVTALNLASLEYPTRKESPDGSQILFRKGKKPSRSVAARSLKARTLR